MAHFKCGDLYFFFSFAAYVEIFAAYVEIPAGTAEKPLHRERLPAVEPTMKSQDAVSVTR